MIKNWKANHSSSDLDAHIRTWDEVVRVGAGVYHISPLLTRSRAGTALVANRLYASPYPISRARTPANLAFEVTTGVGASNIRIGLYLDNGNCYPGARLTNGGAVSTAGTGIKTVSYTTQIAKGLLWVALISDDTPSVYAATIEALSLLGVTSVLGRGRQGWYIDDTYGNLPDPFPAAGATADANFWLGALEWASQP